MEKTPRQDETSKTRTRDLSLISDLPLPTESKIFLLIRVINTKEQAIKFALFCAEESTRIIVEYLSKRLGSNFISGYQTFYLESALSHTAQVVKCVDLIARSFKLEEDLENAEQAAKLSVKVVKFVIEAIADVEYREASDEIPSAIEHLRKKQFDFLVGLLS